MYSRQVIVDKMCSWKGCKEGDATHKHIIDTYNSYKPLPQGYKVKYTDAWCATAVSAAAIECGYTNIIPVECSCDRMIKLLQQKGIWQENDAYVPKPGDIIFYDWQDSGVGEDTGTSEHVGYVKSVNNGIITAIEGNKNDGVEERTIKVNGRYIRGYGVPKYNDTIAPPVIPVKQGQRTGIDISANQASIDFTKVKQAGIDFVILRATTKNGQIDKKFEEYYAKAGKAGIKVSGVYKYSYAMNILQSFNEAVTVLQALRGRECTIWLDLEDKSQIPLGKVGIEAIAVSFLTCCEQNGYDVGIYCNQTWYKNYISDNLKKKYKFWIARYGKNTGVMDMTYRPNVGEVMWQYTSKGKIAGIDGNVDVNVKW